MSMIVMSNVVRGVDHTGFIDHNGGDEHTAECACGALDVKVTTRAAAL